jgi:subfamily B ATP-binding cassette protein MsbA
MNEPLSVRVRRLAPYFKGGRTMLVVASLMMVLSALSEAAIPWLLKPLLDKGFQDNALPLWAVPTAIVLLAVVRGISGWSSNYGLNHAAQSAVLAMRRAMFDHMLRAAPALFSKNTASSITNALVYEIQQGSTWLIGSLYIFVRDAMTVVALLGLMLYLDWRLTLFIVVLFPIVGVCMRVVSKRLRKVTVQGQEATDTLAYTVEENVLAWRIVRLHGGGTQQAGRFDQQTRALRRLTLKSTAAGGLMNPITQFFAALALSAVIVLALKHSGDGKTTVGGFVSFVGAMLMLITPFKHLSDVMAPLTRGLAAMERGIDIIQSTPAESGGTLAPARVRGDIVLRDISLRYGDDEAPPALDGITLDIRAGETVAFVGPSGAGKTSVVNLLPRFLEPTAGTIDLDGQPLRDYDITALRRQFALVSQDVVLFNDSVAANVALGDEIDLARVRDALSGANLLDFVMSLPQGLDAPIGHNGSQLSGGQRQRLAIARAIYKDAPILILDEATSALDSESERAVQSALEVLMKGRTTLVIAHRLSTIEHADRVVAMEAGRVAEQGPPAVLRAAGGLYARLHAMQFRG